MSLDQLRVVPIAPLAGTSLSVAQCGAFLGRVASCLHTEAERAGLLALAAQGLDEPTVTQALAVWRQLSPGVTVSKERCALLSAGVALTRKLWRGEGLSSAQAALVDRLSQSDGAPTLVYRPPENLEEGELESLVYRAALQIDPALAKVLALHHPQIPTPEQLVATGALADELVAEYGPLLAGFNLLTSMHQMGRTPAWLKLLSNKLGLDSRDYLGINVPYSGSDIAVARTNADGFATLADERQRTRWQAFASPIVTDGEPTYEQYFDAQVHGAIATMLDRSDANGKPILVIDDGGHIARILHRDFPTQAHRFRIVEWTKRGIWEFDKIADPQTPFIQAGDSTPKTRIEPAFIADSVGEHFEVLVRAKLGSLTDKQVLLIGYGDLGQAMAAMLEGRGARVSVYDEKPERREAARQAGYRVDDELFTAVRDKHGILAVTGSTPLTSEVLRRVGPATLVASASSIDVEARRPGESGSGDPRSPMLMPRISIRPRERGDGQRTPATTGSMWLDTYLRSLRDQLAPRGLVVDCEAPQLVQSAFPINLSRRVRVMPLSREELPLMNVTAGLVQAALTSHKGPHPLSAHWAARIEELFATHHPADYRRATGSI